MFCLPFGFSFTALRISTWVCAALSLWGVYLLLRELQVYRRDALIGTATLGAYPVFFILSYTFMTDVPWLAAMIWSMLAFVWAVRHHSDRWLWMAVTFACLAAGIRITGLVLPVAMILVLVFHTQRWGTSRGRFLYPLAVFVFFGVLLWWQKGYTEHIPDLAIANVPSTKLRTAIEGLRYLPSMLVLDATFSAGALGLALLPLAVGAVERYRHLQATGIFLLLWGGVWVTHLIYKPHIPALSPGSTWSVGELGATEPLVRDYQIFEQPLWLVWTITTVTLASASVILARLLRRRWQPGEQFLLWLAAGQFLLMAILWLFYDRYVFVLIPPIMVLMLAGRKLARPMIAAAFVGLMAAVSLVGTRDHLTFNNALWQAVAWLRQEGIPISQIDGGYIVNGWLQYAHPQNAPRDQQGKVSVPMIHTKGTLRYRISNIPLMGWRVLRIIPYQRWMGRSGAIYILEQA
jgi:hypothetical protein